MAIRGRSKYKAIPTVVDGIRFHSKAESRHYVKLKLLEKAGEIVGLKLQPEFALYATSDLPIHEDRDPLRLGVYRGDFAYQDKHGELHVVDVKGMDTPLSKWKRKHVAAQYGITVEIVK